MSKAIVLDTRLQQKTLSVLAGLPPDEYFAACNTDDRLEYILGLKHLYTSLHDEFKLYFSGQASQANLLSQSESEILGAMRDWYLAWYTLAQWSWGKIEEETRKRNLPLPESPGDALIVAISQDCYALLQPAFEAYYRSTPHQTRELYRKDKAIDQALSSGKQPAKSLLAQYRSELKQAKQPFQRFVSFRQSIVLICEQFSRKDSTLKRHLRHYRRCEAEMDARLQSFFHKRHKRRGGEWRNGQFFQMSETGGVVYKT